jgi:hypothetical protein
MAQRAKKKPANDPSFRLMKADYYPVQRSFDLRSTATEVDYYLLDVGRNLSVTNKRLYRQGKTYVCKVDLQPADAVQYNVFALADTWMVQKAWQLGRSVYLRSTADERAAMSKQKIARWEDFRVLAGLTGWAGGELVPAPYSNGMASSADTAGEFELSEITLADGVTQRAFTWGATGGSFLGLLEEYDKTGATDSSPSIVDGDNAYVGTDSGIHDSQADDLAGKGNFPPYDASTMNPRVWVRIARLDAAASHGKLSTGYFNAPCGLVVVQPSVPSTAIVNQLSLTVQGGNYKGVKAHNMGA